MGEYGGDGSRGGQPAVRDEVHVLVTGFGPWASNDVNPSVLIAQAIHGRLDMGSGGGGGGGGGPKIHVHTLPEALRVSYDTVRAQVPPLLFPPVTNDPPPVFDFVLLIGLAGGRSYYALESVAARDGYLRPDVDGRVLDPAGRDLWSRLYGAPPTLSPAWDPDDVWRRWKTRLPFDGHDNFDLRVSDDAGQFLCDFSFYTSLVEYWRRGRTAEAQVAFLHVPDGHDAPAVERGVRVAESLIRALVESQRVHARGGGGGSSAGPAPPAAPQ